LLLTTARSFLLIVGGIIISGVDRIVTVAIAIEAKRETDLFTEHLFD
jgi:hypothetical protein